MNLLMIWTSEGGFYMRKGITLAIYGAAIGDVWGSRWEFDAHKPESLDEALKLRDGSSWTDDTVMTAALADAIIQWDASEPKEERNLSLLSDFAVREMRGYGRRYPASYGCSFALWLASKDPKPYDSLGNGAAMRISPAGLFASSLSEAVGMADALTSVTHNHPEGMDCARAVAALVFLAKGGKSKKEMREHLKRNHEEIFRKVSEMNLEGLHKTYMFDETSMGTVPQAIWCFLSSKSFSDCLERSLYIGGDSDTLAAVACSIAAPFYGDSQTRQFARKAMSALPSGIDACFTFFSDLFLRYNP